MEEYPSCFLNDIQKPCILKGHEDQLIQCVCLSKCCDKQSRFLCMNCLIGDHNEHSKKALNIRDIQLKDPRQITNWPLDQENLGKFPKICQSNIQNQKYLHKIQDFFVQFREDIINTINILEKDILIRASEIEHKTINLEQKISQSLSLDVLKSLFEEYSADLLTHDEIMEKLNEYSENLNFEPQAYQFTQEYDRICTENLKNVLNVLPKKKHEIMKCVEKELKPVLLTSINNNQSINRLHFYKSSVERSEDYIQINQKKIAFLDNELVSNDNCRLVAYSDKFHRNQFIKIRFKINYGYNGRNFKYGQKVSLSNYRIPIGIVIDGDQHNGCNWANSGNQVDIGPRLESKKNTKVQRINKQIKSYSTIFNEYQSMVLNIEIKVSENLMKIWDDEQKCIVENIAHFENAEHWRFVISNHVYYTPIFEILQCEIIN